MPKDVKVGYASPVSVTKYPGDTLVCKPTIENPASISQTATVEVEIGQWDGVWPVGFFRSGSIKESQQFAFPAGKSTTVSLPAFTIPSGWEGNFDVVCRIKDTAGNQIDSELFADDVRVLKVGVLSIVGMSYT